MEIAPIGGAAKPGARGDALIVLAEEDVDDSRDGVGAIDCRSTVGDDLDPLDRRSRYRADIDHALRTAVSKQVAIEQRQCGAGPDVPQVEGRCTGDVDVLIVCALPRTVTRVLAAARSE